MVPSAGGTADRQIGQWSGKCEELILGYFALTAVEIFAFTFIWDDPTVWTGRVLQAGCERWRGLVLRFCIRPVIRALVLLAIMDIRAHPISFSERP